MGPAMMGARRKGRMVVGQRAQLAPDPTPSRGRATHYRGVTLGTGGRGAGPLVKGDGGEGGRATAARLAWGMAADGAYPPDLRLHT